MKYLLGFALLLASWLQPLHVGPWISWHSEVLAVVSLIWFALVETQQLVRAGQKRLELPQVLLALPIILAVLVFGQAAVGLIEFVGDAIVIGGYLLMCVIAIAVGYQWGCAKDKKQEEMRGVCPLQLLAIGVLTGAVLSTVIALVQVLDVWPGITWITKIDGIRRPGANLAQANHLGTLLLMGTASAIYLQQTKRLGLGATGVLSIILILGLTLAESRTAWLSLMALTGWCLWKRRVVQDGGYLPLVIVTFWILILLGYWSWPGLISDWFGEDGGEVRSMAVIGLREQAWRQLIHAVLEKPILGWGAGGVTEALSHVASGEVVSGPFTYAHNVVLDLAIGFGVPTAVMVAGAVLYWICNQICRVQTMDAWYALAMIMPVAIHSLLEFPFAYVYFLLPIMMCVGHIAGQTQKTQSMQVPVSLATIVLLMFALGVAWTTKEYLAAEEDYRVARFEALNVGQTPKEYDRPQIFLLTQLDALLTATRERPKPGMTHEQLDLLRRVAAKYPWSALQNRYAVALALNGKGDEAIKQLRVIKSMHGNEHYQKIKLGWIQLGSSEYPELYEIALP